MTSSSSKLTQWFYTVFGLRVASDHPLPGLVEISEEDSIDLHAKFGSLPSNLDLNSPDTWQTAYFQDRVDVGMGGAGILTCLSSKDDRYIQVNFQNILIFIIDKIDRAIWTQWGEGETFESAYPYFMGNALGIFLRLHNVVCLHASSVVVQDRAIAITGDSGMGKSTLAATFVHKGYSILSDDVTVIDPRGDQFYVQPGYPRVRLMPDALQAFGHSEEGLELVHPQMTKRYLELDRSGFSYEARPLAQIYTFKNQPDALSPQIDLLPPKNALLLLFRFGYGHHLLNQAGQVIQMSILTEMVRRIPVYQVKLSRNLDELDNVVKQLVANLDALGTPK